MVILQILVLIDIKKYIRDPFFTYEFKKITQLLEEMKKDKSQMAIVVDEYGGTAGLITIEDLVEVIVGDIEDEYDEEEDEIQVINSNEFLVEGSTKISDVNEVLGIELESEEFDSIGGYIIGYIKHIPEENEVIEVDYMSYKIIYSFIFPYTIYKLLKNREETIKNSKG